jgi:hypothetical protein
MNPAPSINSIKMVPLNIMKCVKLNKKEGAG